MVDAPGGVSLDAARGQAAGNGAHPGQRIGATARCSSFAPIPRIAEGERGKQRMGDHAMMAAKYLIMLAGLGIFGSATALVGYDIFMSEQLRRLLQRSARVERLG